MPVKKLPFLLLGIIVIAAIIRFYQLGSIPVGLHGDEASIGYNAYSLLKTGKDQDGHQWPLAIDQFGDFRPAGYHYLDIPFIAALGLTHLAVRLPSALFGVASIIVFYLLVRELFGKKYLALLSASLLTLSPWHIITSRATSEGVVASFFIILGVFLFLRGTHEKDSRLKLYAAGIASFLMSYLFYHSARLFVPLLFPILALILWKKHTISVREKIGFGMIFFVLIASLAFLLTTGKGSARPMGVSIFSIPGVSQLSTQQIGEDGQQNVLVSRFFHNKLFNYGRVFLSSYFFHISGEFFFVNTGNPIRYRVPWSSNLYLAELPFLLFGFAVLLVDGVRQKKYYYFLPIVWMLLGAVPAGLTFEDIPNIQRASLMIPAVVMIVSFGLAELYRALANRNVRFFVFGLLGLIFFHNVISFFHNYFKHLKTDEPWHRSASIPDLLFSLNELSKNYKYVVMTSQGNNNLIHYLFYNRIDPAYFQSLGSPKEQENLRFENVVYKGAPCPLGGDSVRPVGDDPELLYVNHFNCKVPKNAEVLKTIIHPEGSGAYRILRINPKATASADLEE